MLTRQDVHDLQMYLAVSQSLDGDTLAEKIWDYIGTKDSLVTQQDYDVALASYQRGEKLREQGYYIVYSNRSINPDMLTLQYPNGTPVPPEALLSEVYEAEGGHVASGSGDRALYNYAAVKK